jgi:patatin-like phospholipase/acyl hydrolase
MTFKDRLKPRGQKKLLALDGGGIRGVITLEVLKGIEKILRDKSNNPGLVLSYYFDYVWPRSSPSVIRIWSLWTAA